MTKIIPLSKGFETIIDDEDFERVSQWRWKALFSRDDQYYAARSTKVAPKKYSTILLHRFIISAPDDALVDHINMNKLDNRRCNLRLTDKSGNSANRLKLISRTGTPYTSIYKGVYRYERGSCKRWVATIRKDGKCRSIGYFLTEIEAAKAYDREAILAFGDFAYVNFPEDAVVLNCRQCGRWTMRLLDGLCPVCKPRIAVEDDVYAMVA